MSDATDDEPPIRETLLPSLTLSVLGGTPVAGVPVKIIAPHAEVVPAGAEPSEPTLRPRGARTSDEIGSRYVVEGQIGRGGMGRVLRVRHKVLGKAFALKLIKVPIAGDPRIREMFYREARLASALSHDNICSVVDFGEDELFGLFMVMELLEGKTLTHKVHHDGRFAPKVACDVMMQIAEALRYIHGRAIIHGDIKSENILLTRTPDRRRVVKLLDFGLARPDAAWRSATLRLEGTPEYLAPERIRGEPASHASDIYALGVLFFELLVGRVPFQGTTEEVFRQHLESAVPPPSTLITDEPLDERADEIVARATAKDPAVRQADVSVFLYELRTLMSMLGGEKTRRRAPGGEGAAPPLRRAEREEAAAAEIFDAAPLPLACCDADGNVRAANKAFLEFLGAAGKAAGINLADSGMCDVYPALLEDLHLVALRKRTLKRILHLSEGGGYVVQVAVILTPAPAAAPVTAGEVHIALHPLARQLI